MPETVPTLAVTGDADADALLVAEPLARMIAAMSEADVVAVCSAKPAIHRFPGSMGKRIHQLCTVLVEEYDGDAAAVWTGAKSGTALYARVRALPGFGDEKAKIFVAMLAKRFGIAPRGWKQVTVPFSDSTPRSVADIDSPESLARVRAWKKAQKAAGRSKQD